MDPGDDDMCRTSSAVATPESSYATARAAPLSVSHHSVSSGHSSRKGHLPPVYTTSPVMTHHRFAPWRPLPLLGTCAESVQAKASKSPLRVS